MDDRAHCRRHRTLQRIKYRTGTGCAELAVNRIKSA
jgi:hypothetical protein